MSQFATNFAATATPRLMGYHGQTVTYTPLGGSPVSRTARLQLGADEQVDTDDGLHTPLTATVVLADDATTGIATASIGDKVTIDSVEYKVAAYANNANEWVLQCVGSTDDETTEPGTRRHRL